MVPTTAKVGIDATISEGIPKERYERIAYAYADTAKIGDYVSGKADEPGAAAGEEDVAELAEKIAQMIGEAPRYYTDIAEAFSGYNFAVIARALGHLHATERLWQDAKGAMCLRGSRFGAALAGIRVNEQRMRAAGFHTYAYKLAAFVLAGALAGLAGFLLAARDGVVNPELLSWHTSGDVLLMVILGGMGHLRGAVIGAVVFTLLKELLSTHAVMGPLADHWQLTLGLAIIVFVALLPKGLMGMVERLSPKGQP